MSLIVIPKNNATKHWAFWNYYSDPTQPTEGAKRQVIVITLRLDPVLKTPIFGTTYGTGSIAKFGGAKFFN
jgi:hypothetical protein